METVIESRRVKVYQLNKDSEWIDKGTGICSCLRNGVSFLMSSNERKQRAQVIRLKVQR